MAPRSIPGAPISPAPPPSGGVTVPYYLIDDYAEGKDTGIIDILLVGDIDFDPTRQRIDFSGASVQSEIGTVVKLFGFWATRPAFQESKHIFSDFAAVKHRVKESK